LRSCLNSGPNRSVGEPLIAASSPNNNSRSQSESFELQVLGADDAAEWDRRVLCHKDYSFFHSAAWARVICDTYRHTPHYLVFSESGGESVALIPLVELLSPITGRRAISLPFSDFCEPLVFTGNKRTFIEAEVLRLARERRWNYIELRGTDPLELTCGPAVTYYGHKLDLTGPVEAIFDRFNNGTKGAVRQALKSGLDVMTLRSEDAVRDFFRLHVRTRRRHGVPSQPWAFFMNFHRHIIEKGLGFVVLARMGARTVAGAIFGSFGDKVVYKFAASDPAHSKSRSNNLVLWRAIEELNAAGFKTLHFGRTDLANEGLRKFKLSWGAKEEPIRYARLDAQTGDWTSSRGEGHSRWYSPFFRYLPISLNNALGAMVYPHLD
jgi:CelD/BcsL family acetyltransferase involved in cellulose biosynthesis